MKSTSNSSEAASSVLGSSGLVGVDTLPGRSDGVETSGKLYGLSWDTLKTGSSLDARHPRRKTIQQIHVGAPASTNAEGTQPSGRKLALDAPQRRVSGVKHDLLANIELEMPILLVLLLFL